MSELFYKDSVLTVVFYIYYGDATQLIFNTTLIL